jgi:predicted RecA/RadA family phage recombinase
MASEYEQKGMLIDHTPLTAVTAGQVVRIGSMVGVAPRPIAAGETGVVAIEGVYEMDKATGADITSGAVAYLHDASGKVTGTRDTWAVGYFTATGLNAATTATIRLVPGMNGPTGVTW